MRRICYFFLFLPLVLRAQDVHFSQWEAAPLWFNPAQAGLMDADYRVGAIYRSQWRSVPVPYTTFSAFADGRLDMLRLGPGQLGAGLLALADEAGDGRMRQMEISIAASYLLPLGKNFVLSAAVQASGSNRRFEPGLLTFDEQFDGDVFQAGSPTGETLLENNVFLPSVSAGLALLVQAPATRSGLEFGFGAFHLNRPGSSYYPAATRLPMRFNPHLSARLQVHPRIDVQVRALAQFQDAYRAVLAGAGLTYHLQTARDREFAVEAGLGYRLSDALVPQIGLRFRQWRAGYSFDINTSDFQRATNRRGGPEVYLQYRFTSPQPPPVFKACPIF